MAERSATTLILVSVALYSLFPVFNALSVDSVPPFMYVAKACFIAAFLDFTIFTATEKGSKRGILKDALTSARIRWLMAAATLATVSYVLLVTSFYYASNTGVTILYELWPILALLTLPLANRGKFDKLKPFDLIAIALALLGVYAIVIASRDAPNPFDLSVPFGDQTRGLLMALAAAVIMAVAVALKSAGMLNSKNRHGENAPPSISEFAAFEMINRFAAGCLALFLSALLEPGFRTNLLSIDSSWGFGIIEGAGGLFYWIAISKTRRSTIQLLLYFSPVLSFAWLYYLQLAELSVLILFGAMLIFSANVLAHYRSDRTAAFSMTVALSIASCVYCYYTEGSSEQNSFALLGVPTTLFAILIAFMMERVTSRFRYLQDAALNLFMSDRSGPSEKENRIIDSFVLDAFVERRWALNVDNSPDLRAALAKSTPSVRLQFEKLYLSHTSPILAGEIMVLLLVGLSSILASHAVRPKDMFGDFFPVVLTATVVYMMSTVLEQKNFGLRKGMRSVASRRAVETTEPVGREVDYLTVSLMLVSVILSLFAFALLQKHGFVSFS